eukprot:scaffold2846_cov322-Pavlova_lutheri.AAC.47
MRAKWTATGRAERVAPGDGERRRPKRPAFLDKYVVARPRACPGCKNGCGMLICGRCDGVGLVHTRPGGAGVPNKVGIARCKTCNGQGTVTCPVCCGTEENAPNPIR